MATQTKTFHAAAFLLATFWVTGPVATATQEANDTYPTARADVVRWLCEAIRTDDYEAAFSSPILTPREFGPLERENSEVKDSDGTRSVGLSKTSVLGGARAYYSYLEDPDGRRYAYTLLIEASQYRQAAAGPWFANAAEARGFLHALGLRTTTDRKLDKVEGYAEDTLRSGGSYGFTVEVDYGRTNAIKVEWNKSQLRARGENLCTVQ